MVELQGSDSYVIDSYIIIISNLFYYQLCCLLDLKLFLCNCSSDGSKLKGLDENNALVLPASKSKKKTSSFTSASTKKPLTKKQRKELQKVLERKQKKAQVNCNTLLK